MKVSELPAYKNREFQFPNRDIDPAKKTGAYCKGWAEGIYSLWCRGKPAWSSQTQSWFGEMRAYSRGEQDIEQYKKWLTDDVSQGNSSISSFDDTAVGKAAKREGWYNLLWENLSPAPMIFDAVHGMFDKSDFDLYVDTIDADSRKLAEEQKYIKLIAAENAEWQNKIKAEMGIPIDEDIVYPKSKEDFDMFEAQGGFKLNVAKAMQKMLRYSFKISDWDVDLFPKCIDDLLCFEYAATEDYFDNQDGKWKVGYLDPARVIIQYSNEKDYSDSEYAGYFSFVTISNLRSKLPELTEDQLKELAHNAMGMNGNPQSDWDTRYSKLDPTSETYQYDGFKVPVLHAWWIDTDYKRRLYYKSFRGRKSVIDLEWDSEVKPLTEKNAKAGATQEVRKIAKRQPYECYWVIGTDHVYDFGPIKMASREGLSRPQLPIHVEQLLQPSLMSRMKPIVDQMTQAYLRYQNSLAMMVERGYAVNTAMLANVTLGGGRLKPAEALTLWRQTGILPFSYSASTGLYTGGAATPIVPLEGGMGPRVEETMRTFDMLFGLLEKMTGINPVSLGMTPDPNAPVGTTQASMQATANVLRPILDACYELKQSTGTCLMRRIQIGIRTSEKVRKAYSGIISPSDMEALRLLEAEGVQYGMTLRAKPDAKMRAKFTEWCALALQNVREQRPGVDLPDVMYFETALERGEDLYDLIDQMRYIIEKNKQEAEAQSQRAMETQGQINAQNEQMKVQGEMAKIDADRKGAINEEVVRGSIKQKQSVLDANIRLLEQLREASLAEQGLTITKGGK